MATLALEREADLKHRRKTHLPLKGNKRFSLDSISKLPDEILVSVLSNLEMKEAGRTCVLSKRWRYVWTYLNDFDFDATAKVMSMRKLSATERNLEEVRYLNWVNQVVNAHNAPCINTFRVRFTLVRRSTTHIDKWLYFAKRKGVRSLELNLSTDIGDLPWGSYVLNDSIMFNFETLESLELSGVGISPMLLSRVFSDGLNLQRLSLRDVKVDGRAQMLNTPLGLLPLEIGGIRSLKLKYLDFSCSWHLRKFEIFAPNLTHFRFRGQDRIQFNSVVHVEYRNVASLVNVAFSGPYSTHILHNSHLLSGFSSQLQKLSLTLLRASVPCSQFAATFRNLRQLELDLFRGDNNNLLLALTSLITSCPLLHTFELKLMLSSRTSEEAEITPRRLSALDEAQINAICAHQHLKFVRFVGFIASAAIAQVALCLAEHVPMLEKIVFDPHHPAFEGGDKYVERMNLARRHVQQVVIKQIQQVKRGVNVVII